MTDPNRPLYLCVDCGKYTESFAAHYAYRRCINNSSPIRLPVDHAVKGGLTKPVPNPKGKADVERVKAARRVGETLAKVPARPLIDEAGPAVSDAARRLGVPRRSLNRWLIGGIPWDTADMLAVRYGCHPSEIWPTWFDMEQAG